MFKPTVFRFDNSVQWPGAGPTTEIHADTVRDVQDEGEQYVFIHASGTAIKIDKCQVTAYGVWEDDNVPNMPTPEAYPDGVENGEDSSETNTDSTDTSDQSGENVDAPAQPDETEGAPDITPTATPIEDAPDADSDTDKSFDGIPSDWSNGPTSDDTDTPTESNETPTPDSIGDATDSPLDIAARFTKKRKKK